MLRRISFSATPPIVSRPSDSGTTSSSSTSSRPAPPASMSACTAAPSATTWSGSMSASGCCPNCASTKLRTSGMRVAPPTRITPDRWPWLDAGVLERAPARPRAALEHRRDQRVQLGARQPHLAVESAQREPDRRLRLSVSRSLSDRAASSSRRTTCGIRRRRLVDAGLRHQRVRDRAIEVVAAQRRVAARRLDLEHAVLQLEDRDVERAAAEIEHRERPLGLLVEAVRQRRRGRLVEQPQHLEPRQPARVARGLALRVVEVRRHGDHRALRATRRAPPPPAS